MPAGLHYFYRRKGVMTLTQAAMEQHRVCGYRMSISDEDVV
jgi:hypothetical protein